MAELDALFAYLTDAGRRRLHHLAGLQLRRGQHEGDLHDPRRHQGQVPRRRGDVQKYKFHTSPVYQEFLQGKREMQCTAWASPTRNVKGWKGPCYLITDTHHDSSRRPLEQDPVGELWLREGPRCENCMVHVGYETSAAVGVNGRLGDTLKMIKWQLG